MKTKAWSNVLAVLFCLLFTINSKKVQAGKVTNFESVWFGLLRMFCFLR
jgi:hypothetical protein